LVSQPRRLRIDWSIGRFQKTIALRCGASNRPKGGAESDRKCRFTEFQPPQRLKKFLFVFSGGVYVGKNSARPANVQDLRQRRRSLCAAAGRIPSKKWLCHFFEITVRWH
jgi:ribosomal protein L40E